MCFGNNIIINYEHPFFNWQNICKRILLNHSIGIAAPQKCDVIDKKEFITTEGLHNKHACKVEKSSKIVSKKDVLHSYKFNHI